MRHFAWDSFLEEMISSEVFDGEEDLRFRFGAVCRNRSVELRSADVAQQSADVWQISSGGGIGNVLPRIDCTLRSTEGGTAPVVASLSFDSNVEAIAAGWIRSDAIGAPWLRAVLRGDLTL